MRSLSFPKMFNSISTQVLDDSDNQAATKSNLNLLIKSWKTSLFGDPYFGTNLKRLLFEPNNQVLKDLIIDDIYTSIIAFMPQLIVERKDILVTQDKFIVYINVKCINVLDYTTNLYNIYMTSEEL